MMDDDFMAMRAAFWARVQKTEACWAWVGQESDGRPIFQWRNQRHAARPLAVFLVTGKRHAATLLRVSCGNSLCVRPEHLEDAKRLERNQKLFATWEAASPKMSFAELGALFGITRQRAQQIVRSMQRFE